MALTKIDDRGLKTPIELLNDEEITLGTVGSKLKIYHDSTTQHSFIEQASSVNALFIEANYSRLRSRTNHEMLISANLNGAVELYYDNSKKLETTSTGVSVTGGLTAGSFGSDTLCLPAGCYDVTVGGGSFIAEVTFDFGSLVGAAAGTYTDISVGGAVCGVSGCTDATAANYDPAATVDDGSCCFDNFVAWSAGGGSFASEVGWSIVDANGTVMASGGAPASGDICLPDGCYSLDMTDSWGDGWNGPT